MDHSPASARPCPWASPGWPFVFCFCFLLLKDSSDEKKCVLVFCSWPYSWLAMRDGGPCGQEPVSKVGEIGFKFCPVSETSGQCCSVCASASTSVTWVPCLMRILLVLDE